MSHSVTSRNTKCAICFDSFNQREVEVFEKNQKAHSVSSWTGTSKRSLFVVLKNGTNLISSSRGDKTTKVSSHEEFALAVLSDCGHRVHRRCIPLLNETPDAFKKEAINPLKCRSCTLAKDTTEKRSLTVHEKKVVLVSDAKTKSQKDQTN